MSTEIHLSPSESPTSSSRPIAIPSSSSNASSYRTANAWEDFDLSNNNSYQGYTPSYQDNSFNSYTSNADALLSWGSSRENIPQNEHGIDPSALDMLDGGHGDHDYDQQDYNPQDYDAGQDTPFLILDDQNNMPTIDGSGNMIFPSDNQFPNLDSFSQRQHLYSSNASPAASSIGIPDVGNDASGRSRASSVSSFVGLPGFNQDLGYPDNTTSINDELNRLKFERTDDWQNMQSMGGMSPNRQTIDLGHTAPSPPETTTSPGASKPLSPPQLVIPGDSLMPPQTNMGFAPMLNPNSLGIQPAINIMPATPVSGGGVTAKPTNESFQTYLQNLNLQRRMGGLPNGRQYASDDLLRGKPRMDAFSSNLRNELNSGRGGTDRNDSAATNAMSWPSISASGQSQGSPTATSLPLRPDIGYNLPSISTFDSQLNHAPTLQHASTDPILSTSHSQSGFNSQSQSMMNTFNQGSFLLPLQPQRSRSKSDSLPRPPLWSVAGPSGASINPSDYNATFDEPTSAPFSTINFPPPPSLNVTNVQDQQDFTLGLGEASVRRAISDGGNHRSHKRFAKSEDLSSFRSPRLVPTHDSDFIRCVTMADGSLAPVDPRSPPPNGSSSSGTVGPTRRRPSAGAHERHASLSSIRSSPYLKPSPHVSPVPSPSASPHMGTTGLPGTGASIKVERQLVTTPATKTASASRRRAEAAFTCPVPGCGSTFTRHFNLRGHLRSHNEERPFKCKWPGCEKGFARQHDCKRHEALHLNIRPYTCDGCQKTFARMDALARHNRSEGASECHRVQAKQQDQDMSMLEGDIPMIAKVEPDNNVVFANGGFVL